MLNAKTINKHECSEKPKEVEIIHYYNETKYEKINKWELKVRKTSTTGSGRVCFNETTVDYCPFCGEKLFNPNYTQNIETIVFGETIKNNKSKK